MGVGPIARMQSANLCFSVFNQAPIFIVFPRAGCVVCGVHVFWFWFLVYAPGRSRVRKAEWREVQAESLPIKQETSAKDSTGRARQRKKDKNENAGRLESKGRPDRTESPCKCGLVCGDVDQLHG